MVFAILHLFLVGEFGKETLMLIRFGSVPITGIPLWANELIFFATAFCDVSHKLRN
jgi:hypothetical protein